MKFQMVDSHILNPGLQQFTFKAKVVPIDWGERSKSKALVNMGPKIEGHHWEPTAEDRLEIVVVP